MFLENNRNKKLICDGALLLDNIDAGSIDCVFFDPQYRQIMDKMNYGNEGERQSLRSLLSQMSTDTIVHFNNKISNSLKPSGYLFFWVDKFILAEGIQTSLVNSSNLNIVDMITWDKCLLGMGYRSRRRSEYLLIYQKLPKTTKNWTDRGIPDIWEEKILHPRSRSLHPHRKPIGLISRLIKSTVTDGGYVLDPCAGSFIVKEACDIGGVNFIGCDISRDYGNELPIF